MATATTDEGSQDSAGTDSQETPLQNVNATTEYCAKLQEWMWQYYWGYANWQNWMTLSALPFPPCGFPLAGNQASTAIPPWPAGQATLDPRIWYNNYPYPFSVPAPLATGAQAGQHTAGTPIPQNDARPVQQPNGNAAQAGRF